MTSLLRGLLALLVIAALSASAQAQTGAIPAGGDPALACNQKPNSRTYWTEYGFCDLPVRGPAQAKGLVLWSHGLDGRKAQYEYPPPPIVRGLALAGWDVIKINRNNLVEREWYYTGVRHTDDALQRAQAAKASGYKAVILAGQSYGGGISVEANTKALGIDGVLALSPGYGSDATISGDIYRQHSYYLLESLSAQKGGRVVVLTAPHDV
jgi:pimeloyl-ACP methyl ester carboxylesterase